MLNFEENGTFAEWFEMSIIREELYCPSARIPFRFYDNFLNNITGESIKKVKEILRILLRGNTFNVDQYYFEIGPQLDKFCTENKDSGINYSINSDERFHRMLIGNNAWEGMTWGLDFLPVYPIKLIELLQDFLVSSIQSMPDDMIDGYYQAIEIIQKRFIDFKYPKEIFDALKPCEFEQLISILYKKIGYETVWTKATRDGGKDIIASKKNVYGDEHIYIECKKYTKSELKIETVRAFAYTVLNDKVHKGIIFCTGHVPKTLYNYDRRIKIIDYNLLIELLNSYWGDWVNSVEAEVYIERRKSIKKEM